MFGVNMLGIGLHSYGFMDAAFKWLMLFIGSQVAIILLACCRRNCGEVFRPAPPEQEAFNQPRMDNGLSRNHAVGQASRLSLTLDCRFRGRGFEWWMRNIKKRARFFEDGDSATLSYAPASRRGTALDCMIQSKTGKSFPSEPESFACW